MLEALRAYAQIAAGLGEPAAAKAREAARALLAAGGAATGASVPALAEELLATARSNREVVLDLVRTEVRATVGRLGLTDARETDGLRRRIIALERQVEALQGGRPGAGRGAAKTSPSKTAAKKTAAKKAAR